MHNSIVLDRIQSQTAHPPSVQMAYDAIKTVTLSPPISLEELRVLLMGELGAPACESKPCDTLDEIHFENIYDFAQWYGSVQNHFSQMQRTALDTVLQVRTLIEQGCACKRASREAMAHNYFNTFWTNNRKTDLLATIAKVSGAKKVTIGVICSYPMTPEMPR